MKEKWKLGLPLALMAVFAITLWPDFMPHNFSAAYGLAFCAGVYLTGRWAWWVPLGTIVMADVVINSVYYDVQPFHWLMLPKYAALAAIVLLGRSFKPSASWLALLTGGLAGAILFYFVTNTASWILNPLYPKSLAGWVQALTIGTPGWPHTWEFFRSTLLSGGLFTGVFAGAMKLSAACAPQEEDEEEPGEIEEPEEAKA